MVEKSENQNTHMYTIPCKFISTIQTLKRIFILFQKTKNRTLQQDKSFISRGKKQQPQVIYLYNICLYKVTFCTARKIFRSCLYTICLVFYPKPYYDQQRKRFTKKIILLKERIQAVSEIAVSCIHNSQLFKSPFSILVA